MKALRISKRYVSMTVLFLFLFSVNALNYGAHLIEELGHDNHVTVNYTAADETSVHGSSTNAGHHHDGGQGTHHEKGESCSDSHSHVSIPCQPISYTHSPRLITHLTGEPFRFIPEVYLDKFIPPQNLA